MLKSNSVRSDEHIEFLNESLELAKQSINNNGGPFGAIIVKDNQIISRGNNQVTKSNDPTAHAEVVAIRGACIKLGSHELKDCILYASSEPCPMCLSAIYWAHIESVYYVNDCNQAKAIGFDDSFIYKELALSHEDKKIPLYQEKNELTKLKGEEIFKLWDNKKDKISY